MKLVEKVYQPNQPKTVFPNRTRKKPINRTNQNRLVPIEHNHCLTKGQVQGFFLRLMASRRSKAHRKQLIEDVQQEEQLVPKHPICYDSYRLFDLSHDKKLEIFSFQEFSTSSSSKGTRKNAKNGYFLLETRYRKILAELLRVSSENKGNKRKGKNMFKKEIVQRKENTHGEIRTSLVRGVSSQTTRVTLLQNS